MIFVDFIWLVIAVWAAYALRLSDFWPAEYLTNAKLQMILLPVVSVAVLWLFGLYKSVSRYMGARSTLLIVKSILLSVVLAYPISLFSVQGVTPRSFPIIFGLVAFMGVAGIRFLIRTIYYWLVARIEERKPVLIYGAGGAGVQLAASTEIGGEYIPVGFIDDDVSIQGRTAMGIKIYSPSSLDSLLSNKAVKHVLLALPSASFDERRNILNKLSKYPVEVKTIPSLHEIVSGKSVSDLREVQVEDLLGREPVPPKAELLSESILGKVILVTGAGGSIGSELALQVSRYGASLIVLLDSSEYALYSIEQKIKNEMAAQSLDTPIVSLLGSVLDAKLLESLFDKFEINTVYHAAAYKHVPMVEHNVINGIRNNVLGTKALLDSAIKYGVERFILVSTDKAVRPTNIMGATKRFAELCVQAAAKQQRDTIVSMVRFGNVLGSSGSVVPLFKDQIAKGGPVTVTHEDINRYFMTIPEAASLVIQAGSLANGGEVFVLDMGESVKIVDLAKNMIQLSGHSVRDSEEPEGDIEIKITGLRPGEKLYEELLISGNEEATIHPKIMKANEGFLHNDELESSLTKLSAAIEGYDSKLAKEILISTVKEYQASDRNVDWLE
jgi:FlaA1/EpsC-like NDP-sugar epimerase